jgi:hypothetical protein
LDDAPLADIFDAQANDVLETPWEKSMMRSLKLLALATTLATLLPACGWITLNQPQADSVHLGTTALVSVPVEIEVTKSVYSRVFEISGGPPGTPTTVLSNFTVNLKPGYQNVEILTTQTSLPVGRFTLSGRGVYKDWTGTVQALNESSSFTVAHSAPPAAVTLSIEPHGTILLPRKRSTTVSLSVGRSHSSDPVVVTSTSLPRGVTLSPPSTSISAFPNDTATATPTLSADAFAAGTGQARFKASLASASDATASSDVKVIPEPGNFTWLAPPALGASGPDTPTSPDGLFEVSATRSGASRVWTLTVKRKARNGQPETSVQVTAASWGGAQGSNLAGIAFCPYSPTTSALVLSDDDESDPPITHAPSVTYRLKVIALDGATPRQAGTLEGLRFLSGIQPHLGFSPDCSITASWSIDPTVNNVRTVEFLNMFTATAIGRWSFADTATFPTPSLSSEITGQSLTLTGPSSSTSLQIR